MYIHICICIYVYIYIDIYTHIYICIYVCMYRVEGDEATSARRWSALASSRRNVSASARYLFKSLSSLE